MQVFEVVRVQEMQLRVPNIKPELVGVRGCRGDAGCRGAVVHGEDGESWVLGSAPNSEQRKERRQAAAHRSQRCSVGYTQPPAAPCKVLPSPSPYIFGRRTGPG